MISKKEIEAFLLSKRGYLKKGPRNVAIAIWRKSSKHNIPKSKEELNRELDMIREIQSNLRLAKTTINTKEEDAVINAYNLILAEKNRPKKRLFFDLETSPNIVLSWRIGRDISLSHDDILQERAIICVGYKWEGDDKTYAIEWKKGDDKELLEKFSKIINSADEIITQNGDSFDIKWLRTRCIIHDIPVSNKFNSIDTLKMARAGFKFNCNKLDYMGKILGLGGKIETTYDLWKGIVLNNDKQAMDKMVEYCKMDVIRLEQIYNKLQKFSPVKKFKYKL